MFQEKLVTGSQEYVESIINTVREPLIVLDQGLKVISASRSFYNFFKVEPEATVGQLIYDLGNKQWAIPRLRELLETILPEKAAFDNYEVEHVFAGIGRRIMLLNARQVIRALGKERIILLAIEDVTARKEIEAGLEKARKELAVIKLSEDAAREYSDNIINTVREPLIVLDQDLRVTSASRSFYNFFKVEPVATIGQFIYDLGNKQWAIPKLRELLETILPEKAAFDNFEVEHVFAGIGRRIMLLNARQVQRRQGKEHIILLAIEDITERRKVEATLHQVSLELQERNAELERFLYTASHDLKSPVVTVRTFLTYLEQNTAAGKTEQAAKDLLFIRAAADKMAYLLDDLLAFSRIGRIASPPVRVTLREMADEALAAVAGRISERGVRTQVADDKVTLCGDRLRLSEIWQNLVENACKYMGEQKEPLIELGFETRGAEQVFFVRDNGLGIDPRFQQIIFGLFEKLDPKTEGTGIGLAVVQRIVGLYGGRIWVESAGPRRGACFYFTLPGAAGKESEKGEKI